MTRHPIRVTVDDDLRRSRLTVFFRLLLAIPHIVWFSLWSVAASVAAFASWIALLIEGTLAKSLHDFLAAYVRYTLHVGAYIFLGANPYPAFTGAAGSYPVDLEVDPPERQNRWTVAFRLVLAIPTLLLAAALVSFVSGRGGQYGGPSMGVAGVVAFLAWFACLVRGAIPRGFRDCIAYSLRYAAQADAYVLLLTDRYPDGAPGPSPQPGAPAHPVALDVEGDRRRSRLTTFFRLLLALPHLLWLALWSLAVLFSAIASWVVTLVRGTPPASLHRFHSAFIRYATHVITFLYLVASPFPGFTGAAGRYPVDIRLPPPQRQSRWVTGFRALLTLPAWIVSSALGNLLLVVAFLGWWAALVTARMPGGLRNAGAYVVRYNAQAAAYALLVTDRYPFSGPWQPTDTFEPAPAAS